jgi:hypothetical protein
VTQDQAPRQNRNGDPCPPWCVADHDRRGNSHQTPTVAVEVDGLTSLPDKLPVFGTKADPADTRDRDYVTVAALRYGRDADDPQLHLSAEDARSLLAILGMIDEWDQLNALAAAIRKAAADITGTDGAR